MANQPSRAQSDEPLRISVKNFVDTVHEMRKAQSQLALQGSKVNQVDVKRLEDAVDIRIGMIRELL